jgi:hypothetical protein
MLPLILQAALVARRLLSSTNLKVDPVLMQRKNRSRSLRDRMCSLQFGTAVFLAALFLTVNIVHACKSHGEGDSEADAIHDSGDCMTGRGEARQNICQLVSQSLVAPRVSRAGGDLPNDTSQALRTLSSDLDLSNPWPSNSENLPHRILRPLKHGLFIFNLVFLI